MQPRHQLCYPKMSRSILQQIPQFTYSTRHDSDDFHAQIERVKVISHSIVGVRGAPNFDDQGVQASHNLQARNSFIWQLLFGVQLLGCVEQKGVERSLTSPI